MRRLGTIVEALLRNGEQAPDEIAFATQEEQLSWGDLRRDVGWAARGLESLGLAPGERCALLLPTGLDFVRAVLAVQSIGAVPVAFNPGLPAGLLSRRLARLGCRVALVSGDAPVGGCPDFPGVRVEPVAQLLRSGRAGPTAGWPRRSATAYLQLTSGTTGEPRAAVISHESLLAALRASGERMALSSGDVLVGWVPLHHDLGLVRFVFTPVFERCRCHLVPASLANLGLWLRTIARVRGTVTASSDFGYRAAARLVEKGGLDLGSLRFATNGGEPVRRRTILEFEDRFGVPGVVRPGYGLAEATLGVSVHGPGEPLEVGPAGAVSCGRPLPGTEVRIADASGGELPSGGIGEVLVRGPQVFSGYFDDEAATAQTLRGGWLHTGDAGLLDREGRLYVLGRREGMIKRGGVLVVPGEVEDTVDGVPGVRCSAVVELRGSQAEDTGRMCVVVEVEEEVAADEARRLELMRGVARAAASAAGFPPDEVRLLPPRGIPRTSNGKTRYLELRRLLEGAPAASG